MDERQRIEFLLQRDGLEATRAWVERTLQIYRAALDSGGHAASAAYRPLFEQSIRVMEQWLAAHGAGAAPSGPREHIPPAAPRPGGPPAI